MKYVIEFIKRRLLICVLVFVSFAIPILYQVTINSPDIYPPWGEIVFNSCVKLCYYSYLSVFIYYISVTCVPRLMGLIKNNREFSMLIYLVILSIVCFLLRTINYIEIKLFGVTLAIYIINGINNIFVQKTGLEKSKSQGGADIKKKVHVKFCKIFFAGVSIFTVLICLGIFYKGQVGAMFFRLGYLTLCITILLALYQEDFFKLTKLLSYKTAENSMEQRKEMINAVVFIGYVVYIIFNMLQIKASVIYDDQFIFNLYKEVFLTSIIFFSLAETKNKLG